MQAAMLRGSAFKGSAVSSSTSGRAAPVGRSAISIRAVQPLQGTVVSVKTKQTVVVMVERMCIDEKFGKRIRQTKRYVCHDEEGKCLYGDFVRMEGTRPLSALKRFRVAEVLRSGLE